MKLLLYLLFAHVMADIAFQSEWLAKEKRSSALAMIWHCTIWTGCLCLVLEWFNIEVLFGPVLFLFVGHYVMDSIKAVWDEPTPVAVWLDQLFHVFQCIVVSYWLV